MNKTIQFLKRMAYLFRKWIEWNENTINLHPQKLNQNRAKIFINWDKLSKQINSNKNE